MADGRQRVRFAHARLAGGDHIDGFLQEGAAAEPLELLANEWREPLELEAGKGLVGWQAREPLQARHPMLIALQAFGPQQFV